MVKVSLKGLNIRKSRGKWYVSPRLGGESIVKGFVGSREDLIRHLGSIEMIDAYQAQRRAKAKPTYGPGTLGSLIDLYTDAGNERWARLKPATRQDYEKVLRWLEAECFQPLEWIDEVYVYDCQAKAVKDRWPRFADTAISLLSAMFGFAVKRRMMRNNPAKGVERVSRNDPNANREWSKDEVAAVFAASPPHLLTPLMIARYLGYRGQTIAALTWHQYQPHEEYGRVMAVKAQKNEEVYWLPCDAALIEHLDGIERTSTLICTTSDGRPWKSEKTLQGAISRHLRDLRGQGIGGKGLTLHGLRATFASALKRDRGATDKDVATALGDRSERMGGHYTRHVEKERAIVRLFPAPAKP